MFMQIAIGAIGIAIALMVGYLVIAQVRASLSSSTLATLNATDPLSYNLTTQGMNNAQQTVFAGFGLIAVGIIVLAAFGLIQVFQ